MADGYGGHLSDVERRVRVTLPTDRDGFLQRLCPHCGLLFAVHEEDYDNARVINLRCPRCQFVEPFASCTTRQQEAFAQAHAVDELNQLAEEAINQLTRDLFKGLKSSKHIKVSGPKGRIALPGTSVPKANVDAPMTIHRCPYCKLRFKTESVEADSCPVCR